MTVQFIYSGTVLLSSLIAVGMFNFFQKRADNRINDLANKSLGCTIIGHDKKGKPVWGHQFTIEAAPARTVLRTRKAVRKHRLKSKRSGL